MKKILCLSLAAVLFVGMLLGATACGKKDEAKLICGITDFEPMNFRDNSGNWTGFDTEFALLVGEKLGLKIEFQEIEWSQKYNELESGAINCIWNGFTANSVESETNTPRSQLVDFSYSYMLNQQCIVVKAERAGGFASVEAAAGMTAAAEKGSAGEAAANDVVGSAGKVIDVAAQINAFLEVKSGAVDCAVVDILLAQNIVGKGDYSDLVITDIALESELYAVGFKKGDAMRDKVNGAIKELYDSGRLMELAEKYGLENTLIVDTTFGK